MMLDEMHEKSEAVMRALQNAHLLPPVKSKEDKRREEFGREVITHLESIIGVADFSECQTEADARNVLRMHLRPLFRQKRWKQYAYIADRMIRRLIHVLMAEGKKGLEDDAQKERGTLVV
jgi:hypothetical protein